MGVNCVENDSLTVSAFGCTYWLIQVSVNVCVCVWVCARGGCVLPSLPKVHGNVGLVLELQFAKILGSKTIQPGPPEGQVCSQQVCLGPQEAWW